MAPAVVANVVRAVRTETPSGRPKQEPEGPGLGVRP